MRVAVILKKETKGKFPEYEGVVAHKDESYLMLKTDNSKQAVVIHWNDIEEAYEVDKKKRKLINLQSFIKIRE